MVKYRASTQPCVLPLQNFVIDNLSVQMEKMMIPTIAQVNKQLICFVIITVVASFS